MNTYGYAYQNPTNNIDPDGRLAFLAIPAFFGGGSAASSFAGAAAFVGSASLAGYYLNDFFNNPTVYETRGKNFGKHHPTLPIVNPGEDCDGNCNPCPPGIAPFEEAGNEHGSTTGTHWHKIEYNQKKSTCECFPVSRDSPDGINWK